MTWFLNLLPVNWSDAIGWTLLHSLWQGLVVIMAMAIVIKIFKIQSANIKYWLMVSGMIMIVAWSVKTFNFYLEVPTGTNPVEMEVDDFQGQGMYEEGEAFQTPKLVISNIASKAISMVEANTSYLVNLWLLGLLFFSLRLAGSLRQAYRLKRTANIAIPQQWQDQFDRLLGRLEITKEVKIFESMQVDIPMVIGYLKPIVIIPVGMFNGLSYEQTEAILAHELAHIKRSDFLINIMQSIIETIFFYNPAIWWLSSKIRKEREHACDDLAISQCKDKLTYARALTNIEQLRINKNSMAMGLANNKNQLMKRVKRLVENSGNDKGYEKPISAFILLLLIVCISWYSEKAKNQIEETKILNAELNLLPDLLSAPTNLPQDTVKEEASTTEEDVEAMSYKKTHTVTIDENGNVNEHITEEGDKSTLDHYLGAVPQVFSFEELDSVLAFTEKDLEVVFLDDIPEFPNNLQFAFPDIEVPDFPVIIDLDNIGEDVRIMRLDQLKLDSLPEAFSQEWLENHRTEQKELHEQLKTNEAELRERYKEQLENQKEVLFAAKKEAIKALEEANKVRRKALQKRQDARIKAIRERNKSFRQLAEEQRKAQTQASKELRESLRHHRSDLRMRTNSYKDEMEVKLKKDGYLKDGQTLKKLKIKKTDSIEVNGKKIKDKDKEKYIEITKKYFDGGIVNGTFEYTED